MNKLSIKLVIIVVIIMLVLSCSKDSPIAPIEQIESSSHTNLVAKTGEDRTPFQSSIEKTFAQRKAEGIPIPFQVIFEYRTDSKIAKQTTQHQSLKSGEDFTIIATTIIHFENPEQAGNERWPDVVVEGAVPPDANGFIKEGNYTQFIKEKL